ncbi:MAG: ribose 5-phosphate isomerase B [Bacteroidota bacterium]|nr:ribose 5-phosphate isomerase B [Bacteroidota bacterium]
MARIAIGADHAGYGAKRALAEHLCKAGHYVHDLGTFSEEAVDYPDFAVAVARCVASGEDEFGILLCGSGIGVSIVANKITGIRAANCCTPLMAQLARQHNNANVLCIGARLHPIEELLAIADAFLASTFEGGRHARRVEKIHQLTGR